MTTYLRTEEFRTKQHPLKEPLAKDHMQNKVALSHKPTLSKAQAKDSNKSVVGNANSFFPFHETTDGPYFTKV